VQYCGVSRSNASFSFDAGRNAWIVNDALPADDEALKTCIIRGWIEALPHGAFEKRVADDSGAAKVRSQLHRLTDSGWNAIHYSQGWIVSTFIVAAVTLLATIVGIMIALNH
jgi:hypothetical protein